MDDPAFPHPKTVGARSGASTAPGKSASKKHCSVFPRNPLISLVSRERIQGNPS
jgi:hypothetical protein